MINEFSGIGNLGTNPTLNSVVIDGETFMVVNLRVYFDRPVGVNFKDKGGFWLSVDIWGFRAGEAIRVLRKGARVYLSGTLRSDQWTDKETGEIRSEMRLSADYFFIDSVCVENIEYRERKHQVTGNAAVVECQ